MESNSEESYSEESNSCFYIDEFNKYIIADNKKKIKYETVESYLINNKIFCIIFIWMRHCYVFSLLKDEKIDTLINELKNNDIIRKIKYYFANFDNFVFKEIFNSNLVIRCNKQNFNNIFYIKITDFNIFEAISDNIYYNIFDRNNIKCLYKFINDIFISNRVKSTEFYIENEIKLTKKIKHFFDVFYNAYYNLFEYLGCKCLDFKFKYVEHFLYSLPERNYSMNYIIFNKFGYILPDKINLCYQGDCSILGQKILLLIENNILKINTFKLYNINSNLIYHNEIIDSNNIFCDTLFFDNVEVDDVTKHAINRLIFNTKCKKLIFHNFISNFTGNLYIDYKILIKQGYYCTPDENIRNLVPIKLIDIEANKLQNQEKKLYNSFEGFVKQNKF